ncbi:MAG: DUF3153 domain-containing protein [Acidobacteria bacterium]|nr:DUF3153 domain-containing protein [Acidobacteriota bacterium]
MARMRREILIAFLLGAWLAGTLFMWAVATENFRLVDRLLASPVPEMSRRSAPLARGDARLLMRYQASEVNRLFFARWGWTQLGIGAVLLWLVIRSGAGRPLQTAVLLMLGIAAVLQFAAVPEIIRLGRLLDFAPRNPPPPETTSFWRLHALYTALDGVKALLGVFAIARVLRKES